MPFPPHYLTYMPVIVYKSESNFSLMVSAYSNPVITAHQTHCNVLSDTLKCVCV